MFGWKKRYDKLQWQYSIDMDRVNEKNLELSEEVGNLKARLTSVKERFNEQLESFKSEEHALKMQRERVEIDRLALMNAKANLELQMLQREAQNVNRVLAEQSKES